MNETGGRVLKVGPRPKGREEAPDGGSTLSEIYEVWLGLERLGYRSFLKRLKELSGGPSFFIRGSSSPGSNRSGGRYQYLDQQVGGNCGLLRNKLGIYQETLLVVLSIMVVLLDQQGKLLPSFSFLSCSYTIC